MIGNEITCNFCDITYQFRCPLCQKKYTDNAFKDDCLTCHSCHSQVSSKKLASMINFGLKVDYEKRCLYCQSPTLHRADMNIGHRCFFYPSCQGQVSLFQDIKPAYIFLDFETSSLEVMKGEIIEIGAYKLDENGIDSVFQTFIKASAPLSNKVKSITKIDDSMLEHAPQEGDVFRKLIDFIGSACVVAHNAEFDLLWLLAACSRLNLKPQFNEVLCTLNWAKELGEKSLSLGALSKKYHIGHNNAHRALADAASTKALFFIFEAKNQGNIPKKPLKVYQELFSEIEKKYQKTS